MPQGAVWSGGTLLSLPGKQSKRSRRRGAHYEPQAFPRSRARVEFTKFSTLQALLSSLGSSRIHNSFCLLPIPPLTRVAKFQVRCIDQSGGQPASHGEDRGIKSDRKTRALFQIAALIGSATVVSKILGLVRETVLAAVFGVGPVIDAFSYSSIIPGFFLTLLGGMNGPFHTAVAVSLSKRPKEDQRNLVQRLTIITAMVFGTISMAIFLLASPLVDVLAPGLMVPGYTEGSLTRNLAITQLKIMAPCTILAALIGIGFGTLSTAGVFSIPSLSPALSSITVLVAVGMYVFIPQLPRPSSPSAMGAAVYLAAGTTIGAFAQWGLQVLAQQRAGLGSLNVPVGKYTSSVIDEGIQKIFAVLLPAAVTSGMLQIATYTDLHFASFIPGAAAALGYANLLAMAPLGILSSSILVPMLPMLSCLSKPTNELELQERVRQGLLLSMVLTILMTALTVPLARPIVRIVFQRCAFDASASRLVSSLLVCYVVGSTFYLARDLLVRVFYALGDGLIPFQTSMAAIFANVLLDWLFVQHAGFGAQGLVLATSLVNCGSAVLLMVQLSGKFQGFQLRHWVRPLFVLGCSATIAGIVTKYSYDRLSLQLFSAMASNTRCTWVADLFCILLASAAGATTYFMPLLFFQGPEVKSVLRLLQTKM